LQAPAVDSTIQALVTTRGGARAPRSPAFELPPVQPWPEALSVAAVRPSSGEPEPAGAAATQERRSLRRHVVVAGQIRAFLEGEGLPTRSTCECDGLHRLVIECAAAASPILRVRALHAELIAEAGGWFARRVRLAPSLICSSRQTCCNTFGCLLISLFVVAVSNSSIHGGV
jgi:hypothetical protein